MLRLSIASLAAFGVALLVAERLEGTLGSGVRAGFGLGLAVCVLGALFMRSTMRARPALTLHVFALTFVVKLLVLVAGVLVFRYLEPAAARVDWRSFMISFAAAVAILSPIGSIDAVRVLRTTGGLGLPASPESAKHEASL